MSKASAKVLYLVPVSISEADVSWSIPALVSKQVSEIQHFIVENAKTARRYLKLLNPSVDYGNIHMLELDKHNVNAQLSEIRSFLQAHTSVGLMSEAGLPCIADPGNHVVRMAHDMQIRVKPLTGPSSIILALISSGLNGQNFRFNGYLPGKPDERKKALTELEKMARNSTQIFIETPYRNDAMFQDLLRCLHPDTRLLIASDITGENESIVCRKVSAWREQNIAIGKVPCIFAIGI